MKNKLALIVAILIIFVLGPYAVTFCVPYDKVAVVTTFGKADEKLVYKGSVEGGGGFIGNLYWQWPYPIQSVRMYDARVNTLTTNLEQQQTLDGNIVVVSTFVTWRIDDALAFYRSLETPAEAQNQLRSRMRDAQAVIGEFTFDELTNADPAKLRIRDAEKAILTKLQDDIVEQGYGIRVVDIGVKRIILPNQVANKVFARMEATRQRLAEKARSEGKAMENNIIAEATSERDKIMAFAESRAQQIKAEGDAKAADYYSTFTRNEDFAIFLRKNEALREMLGHNTTFLLDTKITPFELLKNEDLKAKEE